MYYSQLCGAVAVAMQSTTIAQHEMQMIDTISHYYHFMVDMILSS